MTDLQNFNSHAREGRDRRCVNRDVEKKRNFNSHAREGRDVLLMISKRHLLISTHTPVKGVTLPYHRNNIRLNISTHTPVKGVTYKAGSSISFSLISTHTPVKGVTDSQLSF